MSDERTFAYLPWTKKENTFFPEGKIYLPRNHNSNIPCKIEMSIRFCPRIRFLMVYYANAGNYMK